MSKYTHFTKLKHLIFLNGGSIRDVTTVIFTAPNLILAWYSFPSLEMSN
jgi:hypothetical protein